MYVVKNKPVFLFKSGLKLIMRYASRIFRFKKTNKFILNINSKSSIKEQIYNKRANKTNFV